MPEDITSAERWMPVAGYEGHYEVSNLGQVRSVSRADSWGRPVRGRALTPDPGSGGHLRVKLTRNSESRRFFIHRLVLTAFVGPRPAGMEACHNDGNPANNDVANLRWDTKASNAQDRRRHGTDKNARKTHCPHGHEYNAANTYYSGPRRMRHCRTCVLAGQKAKRDRDRQQKAA